MPDPSPLLAQWLLGLARAPLPRTPATAMRSEIRQRILQTIRNEPGISLTHLRRSIGLGWGAFYHQLDWLVQSGVVRLVPVGSRRIAVPAEDAGNEALVAARARLHAGSARAIAQLILDGAGRDAEAIAKATGLADRSVRYHLRALLDAGLIEAPYRGRFTALRPTPLLRAALAPPRASGEP